MGWLNPYNTPGTWAKTNLHCHTEASACGETALDEILRLYELRGYQAVAITDHDRMSEPPPAAADGSGPRTEPPSPLLLPGVEISWGSHLLAIGTSVMPKGTCQDVIDETNQLGGITVLCHPNFNTPNYWTLEAMLSLQNYHGIEIYNAVINRLDGSSLATEKWDCLLSGGRRVWGFASDDFHRPEDLGKAWNMVRVPSLKARSLLDALRKGAFYCSTGVEILDVVVQGDYIGVETWNAERVLFIGGEGRLLHVADGSRASRFFDSRLYPYVRIEAEGRESAKAWSQPLFAQDNAGHHEMRDGGGRQ